jgi:hypothetical protein
MTPERENRAMSCEICSSNPDVRYYEWVLCGVCFGVLSRLLHRQAAISRRLDMEEAFRDTQVLRGRLRR